MAVAYDLVSWDGNSIGPGTDYHAYLASGDRFPVSGTVATQSRRTVEPHVLSTSLNQRRLTVHVRLAAGAATSLATFRANMKTWFDPASNASGARYLVMYAEDGTTQIRIAAYVEEIQPTPRNNIGFDIALVMPRPYWEAASATTSADNPATVTNAGNVAVRPSIELETGTHKTRRACTVTPVTAWPVTAYPARFLLSDANATSSNVFVYVNGVLVPCYVTGGGSGSSAVWALVDCADDGTPTYVEIFYGSGMTNSLCGALSAGTMRSASTNASWEWDDWTVLTNPNYCGQWRPDNLGNHHTSATAKYRITDGGSVVISLATTGVSTFDAISLRVPSGWDSTATSIDGLSRTTANLDGTNAQAFVRALYKSSATWVDLWTTRANAAVSTDINGTDGAIMLSAGLENDGATNDPATLTLTDAGGVNRVRVDLLASTTPTVVVGAATNVDYYNGTYQVGGYTLTFAHTLAPDGTLAIDCQEKTISSSASGPIINMPTFSDPSIWAALEPGSNTITDGISATDAITHRDGFG